jgi:hypothetical protein
MDGNAEADCMGRKEGVMRVTRESHLDDGESGDGELLLLQVAMAVSCPDVMRGPVDHS